MAKNLKGSSVNGSGSLIATAKTLGGQPLDTTKAVNDTHTFITLGGQLLSVKEAINIGLLDRDTQTGALVELNRPAAPTRLDRL